MSVIGPSRPPCADCGDDESTIFYPLDGEWACDEPALCMERQRDQAVERLAGAVDRIRDLEQALDRAADDLRSLGHFEMSERAYAPLGTEWGL